MSEGEPRPDRHLRADDAMAAEEVLLRTEHVHRAALAVRIGASARLTRLGLRATAIPGVPPDCPEAWWQTPRFATSGAAVAGLQNRRFGAPPGVGRGPALLWFEDS